MQHFDDPRLSDAVIPPSVLVGVVEIGQREGQDVSSWFAGTGIEPTQLETSDAILVSFRQAATVLRRAVRAMPARPLGIEVARRDVLLTFGMLGVAMRSCATVADSLTLGLELHQASGSLIDVDVESFGDEVGLRLFERVPEPELTPFLCEEAFCTTQFLMRSLTSAEWSPTYLELTYPAPVYSDRYRRFFGCNVQFGAEANRMMMPAALLSRSLPAHNEPVRAMAVEACRRLIGADRTHKDIAVTVEALIAKNLRKPATMAEVAAQLHVTERTLRRDLSCAGERFSAIRDRVRQRRATLLLSESSLTIDAIAREIGFSDRREFRRAYLRWTGYPPSATRQSR